jgi:ribosomal protein L37AE/L43A
MDAGNGAAGRAGGARVSNSSLPPWQTYPLVECPVCHDGVMVLCSNGIYECDNCEQTHTQPPHHSEEYSGAEA